MQYRSGRIGRAIVIKFEDGDDLVEGIKEVAEKEGIKAGFIQLLGGMQCAAMVTGPKDTVKPPEPMWETFSDGREILGVGSIFMEGGKPAVHLHGALGRNRETLTGCLRESTRVFLVIEALLVEIEGVEASKKDDPITGIKMLGFD